MYKRNLVVSIIGSIIVIISILLFLLIPNDKSAVDSAGIFFILFAEIIATGGIILSSLLGKGTNNVMLNAGVITTLSIYTFISISVSLLFMIILRNSVIDLIVSQLILFSITAIILILLFSFAKFSGSANTKTMETAELVEIFASKIQLLLKNSDNLKYKTNLQKLYDVIKYGNYLNSSIDYDKTIKQKIDKLSVLFNSSINNGESEKVINNSIFDIIQLFEQHKIEARQSKQGMV